MSLGFFGKLPAHGDFVERDLPQEFVVQWDQWLQTGIQGSQDVLGERWSELYQSAPPWHFAISKNVCGELGWTGVMAPSLDRVGRRFPVTLAAELPEDALTLQLAVGADFWHGQMERLVIESIDSGETQAEQLLEILKEVDTSDLFSGIRESGSRDLTAAIGGLAGLDLGLAYGGTQGQGVLCLAHRLLELTLGSYSVWWTHGNEMVEPTLLACRGLPGEQGFARFLAGDASPQDWLTLAGYKIPQSSNNVADENSSLHSEIGLNTKDMSHHIEDDTIRPGQPESAFRSIDSSDTVAPELKVSTLDPGGNTEFSVQVPVAGSVAPQISSDDILAGLGGNPPDVLQNEEDADADADTTLTPGEKHVDPKNLRSKSLESDSRDGE